MSNTQLIIAERSRKIGDFLVGRLLPFREKKSVGPFVFIDHMGPALLGENENLDVPPHPHIGLSTLTFLLDGNIMHRDSLGNTVEIKAGDVNFMTAGKGIVHSERTPDYLRKVEKKLHGLQIWIALPKKLEEMDPSFHQIKNKDLPFWESNGLRFTLIAGEAFGKKSAVPVFSPLYFIEIKSTQKTSISLGSDLYGESGIYILKGSITCGENTFGAKQLLVSNKNSLCDFTIEKETTLYVFGGESFPEERFIDWNFVATSKDLIDRAKENWRHQRFKMIDGEIGFVPLPSGKLH